MRPFEADPRIHIGVGTSAWLVALWDTQMPLPQWLTTAEQAAFKAGFVAAGAANGKERTRRPNYPTYNERAAFNDGWDTYAKKTRTLPHPTSRR